jgi:two-component system chemotaxis family response regulator WspR
VLRKKKIELQRITDSDGLTGACNRRRFDENIQDEWSRALRD